MHSIKMHDATDLMPRLMIIHSTADMYAARRRNVSQLRKTLDSTHALEVLRYQSALYAAVRKIERKSVFDTLYATLTKTGSGNKAIAVYRNRVNKAHADSKYAALIEARSGKFSPLSTKLIRAHRRCIRSGIKTQLDSKTTADSECEHSTEGEHQSQEASEVQSMTDTTMTQSMASTTDIMECTTKRQSTL
jgi:hypothetical protein